MKGRIKREDLDHLLHLIQKGRSDHVAAHDAGDDDGGGFAAPDFARDHALWDANQAFWTEKLKSDTGGTWTDAQYTAAASIINTAEYQHVVFSDIAGVLTRGLSEGWHSGASHERHTRDFHRAHHSEPSHFDETFDLVDASTGQVRQVRLAAVVEDVREHEHSVARHGNGNDTQPSLVAEEVQVAPETGHSRKAVNLGELTGSRARDTGHAPFNQARGELYAQCGLTTLLPYSGWDDFQHRNHLSDTLITDLKAAYPEGFSAVDLWVGGLAEAPAVGDLGPTIAAAVGAQNVERQGGGDHSCLDLLAGTQLLAAITTQTWPDIVGRITGEPNLAHYVLASADHAIEDASPNFIYGTDGDDVLTGTAGHDIIFGGAGNDFLDGRGGADVMVGGPGNDTYVVDNIGDRVIEKSDGGSEDTVLTDLHSFALDDDDSASVAGTSIAIDSSDASQAVVLDDATTADATATAPAPQDAIPDATDADVTEPDVTEFGRAANVENLTYTGADSFTGEGNSSNNVIRGGAGNDALWGRGGDDVLYGSGGDDALYGGKGDDVLFGGSGDDRFDGGSGDDVLYVASRTTGDDADETSYGSDTIVLQPGFGNDVVVGFDAHDTDGHDRLDVSAYASLTADSIGAEIQITASGPHTIITINEDSITLLDVSACAIGKDDFIFS